MSKAAAIKKPEVMDTRFVEGTNVKLEDVELRFSHLITPDTGSETFKKPAEFTIQARITDEQAKKMEKVGFRLKEDEGNGTKWLVCKTKVRTAAGVERKPPIVVDGDGNPLTREPGNGSKGNVTIWCKYTDPIKGEVYLPAYIEKVIVTELEEAAERDAVKF